MVRWERPNAKQAPVSEKRMCFKNFISCSVRSLNDISSVIHLGHPWWTFLIQISGSTLLQAHCIMKISWNASKYCFTRFTFIPTVQLPADRPLVNSNHLRSAIIYFSLVFPMFTSIRLRSPPATEKHSFFIVLEASGVENWRCLLLVNLVSLVTRGGNLKLENKILIFCGLCVGVFVLGGSPRRHEQLFDTKSCCLTHEGWLSTFSFMEVRCGSISVGRVLKARRKSFVRCFESRCEPGLWAN